MADKATRQVFAGTDVGRRHTHNEDNFLVDRELGLCVVCDGMGGHAAGEVASAIAVRTVHEELLNHRRALEQSVARDSPTQVNTSQILGLLQVAIQRASARIYEAAQRDTDKRGMGTTLSLLLVLDSCAYVAHVGDSRIYLERDGTIHQVTDDHTVAKEVVRLGMATPEVAARLKQRDALTRAVGVHAHVQVDTLALEVLPTDQFLLASDGLTRYFEDESQTLSLLRDQDGEHVIQSLIDFANESGGKDNITAVLMRLGPQEAADTQRARQLALKRDILSQMPLFSRLDERELLRVLYVARVVDYPPGDFVMREGERGDELYVVLTGRLQVSKDGTVLRDLGPGDHLGEMALIRSRPRSATVVALEPSELVTIRRPDFLNIIRGEPPIAVKLLWQFVGVLADWLDQSSQDLSEARRALVTEDVTGELEALDEDEVDLFAQTMPVPIVDWAQDCTEDGDSEE